MDTYTSRKMRTSSRRAALLCLIVALGLVAFASCARVLESMEEVSSSQVDDHAPDIMYSSTGRLLLNQAVPGEGSVLLAAGALGRIIQRAADEPVLRRTRMLLGKDDDEDDDDDDDDDDDEGSSTKVSAIVGVHIKEFKAPKRFRKKSRKDDDDEDDDDNRKRRGSKRCMLRDEDGELVYVETPVSPRFAQYLGKEPDFLDRIAYLGTIKRRELNSICKKVAKGKTKFSTDVNIDEAKGAPDTGDDITGAKVDHQFGCTVTRGPRVKLNPKLKTGVVFALLELGASNNLIDCQRGVKKCNIWQLLDDEDVEQLTEMHAKGRRLQMNTKLLPQSSAARRAGDTAASGGTQPTTTTTTATSSSGTGGGTAVVSPVTTGPAEGLGIANVTTQGLGFGGYTQGLGLGGTTQGVGLGGATQGVGLGGATKGLGLG